MSLTLTHYQEKFQQYILAQNAEFEPGHKYDHVARVANLALKLANQENAKLEIVIPASWLHDCVAVSKSSPLRKQSSRISAEKARELLIEFNYDQQYIDEICHAIEAHSYSANITPTTIEAKVVQDADRLDALGAIGIARTMMLGSTFNSDIYHPSDPYGNQRKLEDDKYIVDHFFQKLFKLKEGLNTQAGIIEAEKRIQFMHSYLEQLGHEIGFEYSN